MDWKLVPALVTLRREVNDAHPDRDKTSDGTIGDAAHSSRSSSHNPDERGWVRAWDVDASDGVAQAVVDFLVDKRDPRIRYLIWQGRIWRASTGWLPYDGANPHNAHAHINAEFDDRALIDAPFGYGRNVMNPAQEAKFDRKLDHLLREIEKIKVAVGRLDAERKDDDPDVVADRVADRIVGGIAVEGRLTVKDA